MWYDQVNLISSPKVLRSRKGTHMLLVWMYAPKRQTAGMSGTGEGYEAVM